MAVQGGPAGTTFREVAQQVYADVVDGYRDRAPVQDADATSVFQYFSGAVIMILALLFDAPCWAMLLFFTEAVLRLLLAFGIQNSPLLEWRYFDPSSPRAGTAALWSFTVQQMVRWEMVRLMMVPPGWAQVTFTAVFLALGSFYVYYVLAAPLRLVKTTTVAAALVASSCLLGLALVAKHFNRPTVFVHHRHDYRLLQSGLTQLLSAALVYPLSNRLPAWLLEMANLLCWVTLWLCSGHKHIVGS